MATTDDALIMLLQEQVAFWRGKMKKADAEIATLRADLAAAQNKGDISHVLMEAEGKGLILHHNGYTLLVPEVKKVDLQARDEVSTEDYYYDWGRGWDDRPASRVVNRVVVEW